MRTEVKRKRAESKEFNAGRPESLKAGRQKNS
jgi:hypothetical protein